MRVIRFLVGFAFFASTAGVARAQFLNPETYTSDSGEYELSVSPSAPNGKGPSRYQLTHLGEEVWSGGRPFSLWQARVTDDGFVGGYAYEGGVFSGGHHGTGYSDLTVFMLDSKGEVLLRDPIRNHEGEYRSWGMTPGNCPAVFDIWLDDSADRFVVCVPLTDGDSPYAWWIYQASNGVHLFDVPLATPSLPEDSLCRQVNAEIVPGTSLMMIHWYVRDKSENGLGRTAALELVSLDGIPLWEQVLPREYESMPEFWFWWSDEPPLGEQLTLNQRGFQFNSIKLASSIQFTVEPDADAFLGWRVAQRSVVTNSDLQKPEEAVATPRSIDLEFLGEMVLRVREPEKTSIHGIYDFRIEQTGNLAFLQRGEGEEFRFVRVTTEGEVLLDLAVELPEVEPGAYPIAAPTGTGRWILIRNRYAEGEPTRAWWFDPSTGAVTDVPGLLPGHVNEVMGTGDGGFVTLGSIEPGSPSSIKINLYDPNGEPLWDRPSDGYADGSSFRSAVWLKGRGVVTITSKGVQLLEEYDRNGLRVHSVELDEWLGREANYPSQLSPGRNGGFFLHDFGGTPSIIEFDPDGHEIGEFSPAYSDGRTFRITGGVRAAPDGTLWTSDSHALLRLGPDGTVDNILGRGPDDGGLEEVRALAVDSRDRIHVVNGRSSAVHVFDREGTLLKTGLPLPTDFRTAGGIGSITVDGDGAVYYHTGVDLTGDPRYLKLSGNCERMGFETIGFDSITEQWLFQPGTTRRWVLGFESIGLFDAAGKLVKEILKRPNGEWIQRVDTGAVGPDGSLAVLVGQASAMWSGNDAICLYGPDGEPVRTIPLTKESSFEQIVFNGATVVTLSDDVLHIYREDSDQPLVFEPEEPTETGFQGVFRSADADELWLLTWSHPVVKRYAWPE